MFLIPVAVIGYQMYEKNQKLKQEAEAAAAAATPPSVLAPLVVVGTAEHASALSRDDPVASRPAQQVQAESSSTNESFLLREQKDMSQMVEGCSSLVQQIVLTSAAVSENAVCCVDEITATTAASVHGSTSSLSSTTNDDDTHEMEEEEEESDSENMSLLRDYATALGPEPRGRSDASRGREGDRLPYQQQHHLPHSMTSQQRPRQSLQKQQQQQQQQQQRDGENPLLVAQARVGKFWKKASKQILQNLLIIDDNNDKNGPRNMPPRQSMNTSSLNSHGMHSIHNSRHFSQGTAPMAKISYR